MLELVEEAFDQIALAIERLAEAGLPFAIGISRDVGHRALGLDQVANAIGVIFGFAVRDMLLRRSGKPLVIDRSTRSPPSSLTTIPGYAFSGVLENVRALFKPGGNQGKRNFAPIWAELDVCNGKHHRNTSASEMPQSMRSQVAGKIQVLNGVDRCPHCSIAKPLIIQYWAGETSRAIGPAEYWALFACMNCGGGIAARGPHGTHIANGYPTNLFPEARKAHEDIPDVARTFLQQAMDTLHAPDAAAVMAGSAVDAMLKELGYPGGSVYSRIDEALNDNKLTQGMADWAHEVRLGSNRPRHADANRPHVSIDEAKQSVEFAEALANFLFVLTARIERGIQAAASVQP